MAATGAMFLLVLAFLPHSLLQRYGTLFSNDIDDQEAVQIARCLESRQDYRQEYRVVWPSWIEGRARIQCNEEGQPLVTATSPRCSVGH